jgi:polyphosphate kinase
LALKIINRDISWLSFNERVLQEAQNTRVPLIERMRFLGIYSNNLDEFFRVRVATLIRLKKAIGSSNPTLAKQTSDTLSKIHKKVIDLQGKFYTTYEQILKELEEHDIHTRNDKQLSKSQQNFVRKYFLDNVESLITPLIISNIKRFPYLKDRSVYLFTSSEKTSGKKFYTLIELPTDEMSRFIILPSQNGEIEIIYLDDIIRFNMPYILSIFNPKNIRSYIIKLTRDAELDLDDDFSESYYEKINKSLSNRKFGKPVRFVYDKEMPEPELNYLLSNIKLSTSENLIPGGRYHNFRDFMSFPSLGKDELCFNKISELPHKLIKDGVSLLKQVEKQDFLFQFPYHSFDYIIDIIREAAIDPKVELIKMSLYRVAKKSKIIKALKNAARNGKIVQVVIELRARFDEEANLDWSKQLQEENISIEFGVKGLKVHSKLLLIQRRSKGILKNFSLISTGNFHENTARIYGDTALFTANESISGEVEKVFQIFDKPYMSYHFEHLLVSPINLRQRIYDLVDEQIVLSQLGGKGEIYIKINNLVDEEMIAKLNDAAENGVKIRLMVRGVCSLVPIRNITVRSIVGRFLEHSRVLWFGSKENAKIFIGSADLMTRNLDVRIEAMTPIYDEKVKLEMIDYMELQWKDNQKCRKITSRLSNDMYTVGTNKVNAQMDLYNQLK